MTKKQLIWLIILGGLGLLGLVVMFLYAGRTPVITAADRLLNASIPPTKYGVEPKRGTAPAVCHFLASNDRQRACSSGYAGGRRL